MIRVEFDFCVPADHPSLSGHFPGQPIVPGVLLLDRVIEILEQATGRRVRCLQEVKFRLALRPGEEAHVLCEVDGNQVSFRVSVQPECASVTVASGNLLLHANDEQPG